MPTHTCFDDALDFVGRCLKVNRARGLEMIIVHGILLSPAGPTRDEPFAHAWVEYNGEVWQDAFLGDQRVSYAVARAEFEKTFRPQKETRYTVAEASRENERSGHYGPWLPEYEALCRQPGQERLLCAIPAEAP